MIFPREDYEVLIDDSHISTDSCVAFGCPHPDCSWTSKESRVSGDTREDEIRLAFQAIEDQWERHWADRHQPEPLRLLAKNSPTESETE